MDATDAQDLALALQEKVAYLATNLPRLRLDM